MDFLHKLSYWLVMTYTVIVFENLNIQGMAKNPHLAKSILDAGWSTLINFTTYKSVKFGVKVCQVDPRYTSQDCSGCGKRVPKTLAERVHKCPHCLLEMCRDQNAAINIKNRVGVVQSKPPAPPETLVEKEPLSRRHTSSG